MRLFERTRSMANLKFHPAEGRGENDPIPFPKDEHWTRANAPSRWRDGAPVYRLGDNRASSMAEKALDRAQRQMDRLRDLLGNPDGSDRPSAA
ncbi:MAG TPA: hypothetical protein VF777_16080 [Phycisphaerales bacterium]